MTRSRVQRASALRSASSAQAHEPSWKFAPSARAVCAVAEAVSPSAIIQAVSGRLSFGHFTYEDVAAHTSRRFIAYHPIAPTLMGRWKRSKMPKLAREMGALAVGRLAKERGAGLHFVGGVPGLAMQVTAGSASSWTLRAAIGGRRRDMGLGGYPAVTLAMAREKAREARELIRKGIDPIEQQRAAQSALRAAVASALTFKETAKAYMTTHEAGWKNAKHAQQWRNTLAQYAYPVMGELLVRDVSKEHVLAALRPIWTTKNETASRLRSRIELVLSYAMQAGYRPEGLPRLRVAGTVR